MTAAAFFCTAVPSGVGRVVRIVHLCREPCVWSFNDKAEDARASPALSVIHYYICMAVVSAFVCQFYSFILSYRVNVIVYVH